MKILKKVLLVLLIIMPTVVRPAVFLPNWLKSRAVYGYLMIKNWVWPSVPVKNEKISVEKLYQARLRGVKQSDLKFGFPVKSKDISVEELYQARLRGKKPSQIKFVSPGQLSTSSSDLGGESSGAASGTVTGPRPAVRVPVDGRNLSVQAEKAVMEQFRRQGLDPIKNRDDFTRAYFCELDFLIAQRAAQRSATDSGSLRK